MAFTIVASICCPSSTLRIAVILLYFTQSLQSSASNRDTPNSEDGDIPVDVYRARVDARPLTANGEDSDSLDLEPFWEMLNADRSRAMERMRIKYLESRRHRSSSGRQIIQITDNNDNETETNTATAEEPKCGVPVIRPKHSSRIVGGREARPNSWPFMSSLQQYTGDETDPWVHICGACIISRRWILTAAHCVKADADNPTNYRIVAGEHDLSQSEGTESVYEVEKVIMHEKYGEDDAGYDIALIKLSTDVQYSDAVRPVCLPDSSPPDYTSCVAIGWGETQGTGREEVLNEVIVALLPNSMCGKRAWYGRRIKADMVCAGYEEGGRDSCSGDSGGPLVRQPGFRKPWQLTGITSWGILCGMRRKPGVYTRVYLYLDWIHQHTEQ